MEEKISENKNEHSSDLKYWLAYSRIQKIGPINFKKLANYFNDLKTAWQANANKLISAGLNKDLVEEIIIRRSQINPDQELNLVNQEGLKTITIKDDNYPRALKEIYNPPPLLYLRGSIDALNNICLAVVGTRKFSAYGRQATEEIVYQLAERGLTIISGLALGIDALAHLACLNANGKTVAILGSGADQPSVYPSSNRYLIDKIISSQGAVISEYPVGTAPTKYTFPMRNRIISGLAKGVLVIEAPESSGALITAKYALDQNRDVFAIPGSIYSHNSKGVNNLIKQGAKLITGADDILQEFNIQVILQETKNEPAISQEEEKIVFNLLSKEPLHIDKIKQLSKLNINVLSSALTMLEIKGLIKDIGGKHYLKR